MVTGLPIDSWPGRFCHLSILGCRNGELVVSFNQTAFGDEDATHELGEELFCAVRRARDLDATLYVSFRGVSTIERIVGKLVLLGKSAKTSGVPVQFVDISPELREAVDTLFNGGWPPSAA